MKVSALLCASALGLCAPPLAAQEAVMSLGAPRLTLVERGRFGADDNDPDGPFGAVAGAAILWDEYIAVADGQSQQIRILDRTGRVVSRFGGVGDGPGEFRRLAAIAPWRPGNGVLAWDDRLGRVTLFGTPGNVVRSYQVDRREMKSAVLSFVGVWRGGGVLLRSSFDPQRSGRRLPGVYRDSVTIGAFDEAGAHVFSLDFIGPERDFYESNGTWGFVVPILGRHLVHAVVADTLFVAHTDSLVLRRFADARELRPVRLDWTARPASGNAVAGERTARRRQIEASLRASDPPELRAIIEQRARLVGEIRAFATLPAFSDIIGSEDGSLWLVDVPNRQSQVTRLLRMTIRGGVTGAVEVPVSERVLAVSDALVVSVTTDAYGRESVVLREIRE